MLLCGAGCCLWTRGFSGRRARPRGLVLTCGLARCPDAQLWLPTTNFACNSPATISNSEFTALKSQRFKALLNLHPIELHATFEEDQAPPPMSAAARSPAFRSLRCRSPAFRSLRHPPHRRGLRGCCSARCPDTQLWLPTTNFACNSPATISNSEFTALKSQRFQALLNLHPIELHAKFGWRWSRGRPLRPSAPWAAREPSAPRASIGASARCPAPPPTSAAARSPAFRSLRYPPRRWWWGVLQH